MSELSRLEEKLAKLRQAEPRVGGGRVLSGQDAAQRLRAALSEIDETILPRQIVFRADGSEVRVGVANRQLSLILEGGLAAAELPHVVDGRDDPVLAEFRDGLLKLFGAVGPFSVLTERLDRDMIQKMRPDAGVSASVLASIWEVGGEADPSTEDSGDICRRFIDRVGARCDAWLLIEGEEIAASGGSERGVEWLGERAGGFLDGYYARREIFDKGVPLAFAFNGGTGASLVYFESGEQAGFATLPPSEIDAALRDWHVSVAQ